MLITVIRDNVSRNARVLRRRVLLKKMILIDDARAIRSIPRSFIWSELPADPVRYLQEEISCVRERIMDVLRLVRNFIASLVGHYSRTN